MTVFSARNVSRGGKHILASQVVKFVVQILSLVCLSHLIAPSDVGVYAMCLVAFAFADTLRDFGTTTVGLAAKELNDTQSSNLFWISFSLGILLSVGVAAASSAVSLLFNQPEVAVALPVVAIGLAINGAQAQLQVRLARTAKFASLGWTNAMASTLSFTVGFFMALLGFGLWALVGQLLTNSACLLVSRALILRWLPQRPHLNETTFQFIRKSSNYGVGQFLTYLLSNVDNLVIGIFWGAKPLGEYSRAFQLEMIPMVSVFEPLTNLVLPTLSQRDSPSDDNSSKALSVQFLVGSSSILFYACLAATASELIPFILGPRWAHTGLIVTVLCAAGALQGLNYITYWRILAADISRQYLALNVWTTTFGIVAIIVSARMGVEFVALALVVNQFVKWPLFLSLVNRHSKDGLSRFLKQGIHLLVSGLGAVTVAGLVATSLGNIHPALKIALELSVVGFTYLALLAVSDKNRQQMKYALKFVGKNQPRKSPL